MNFIPNRRRKEEMLRELGLSSEDELFADIPRDVRLKDLRLPEGMPEADLRELMKDMSHMNSRHILFVGGGMYRHYIPSAVSSLVMRSEFYTSYTPYQPEVSQGMLQALFEYQSYMAVLTGMDAVNASMYDWGTALGEAVRMALRISGKSGVVVPRAMYWDKMDVLRSYLVGTGAVVREVDYSPETGRLDMASLDAAVGKDTACIYLENPNFFGVWEPDALKIKDAYPDVMYIVGVNPVSLAVAKPPGEYGADIVVGEGQPLGMPVYYGGPGLGIFGTRQRYVRKMPGRLIGMTEDAGGRRAFVMTLQTREQHIRRQRATSNICSNQALCALQSLVYMALMGPDGLRKVAETSAARARELADALAELDGVRVPYFSGEFFNEFVYIPGVPSKTVFSRLQEVGITGGLRLRRHFPELGDAVLTCATETVTSEDVVRYASVMREVVG